MAFCLVPDLIFPALTDVTAEALRSRGITFLMLDFDNTIVPYTTDEPTEKMRAWLASNESLRTSAFASCPTAKSPRVVTFCRDVWVRLRHAREKAAFTKGISECLDALSI